MNHFNTLLMITLTTLATLDYAIHQNIQVLILLAVIDALLLTLNFLTPLFSTYTQQYKSRIQKLEQEVSRLKTAFNLKDWDL